MRGVKVIPILFALSISGASASGSVRAQSEAPSFIEWTRTFDDRIGALRRTSDGGYLVAGSEIAKLGADGAIDVPPLFRRGDCNGDGAFDISDAVSTLASLFLGEGDPGCDDACDSNDDGAVDISYAVAALGVLFLGQGEIPLPGTKRCGADLTADPVDCERHEGCP